MAHIFLSLLFFSLYKEELQDVVFLIQSQRNLYYTYRADQERTELLHQAQTLNQVVLRKTICTNKCVCPDAEFHPHDGTVVLGKVRLCGLEHHTLQLKKTHA